MNGSTIFSNSPIGYSVFTFDEQLRYHPQSLKELRKGNPFNQKLHSMIIGVESECTETDVQNLINGCYFLCVKFCHDNKPMDDPYYQYVKECQRFGRKDICITAIQILLGEYSNQCKKNSATPLQPFETISAFCDNIESYKEAELSPYADRLDYSDVSDLKKEAAKLDLSQTFYVHPTPTRELRGYNRNILLELTHHFDEHEIKKIISYYTNVDEQLELMNIIKDAYFNNSNALPF